MVVTAAAHAATVSFRQTRTSERERGWVDQQESRNNRELPAVLPHLANFRNSCEFEGLIATQKDPLRLAKFLRILSLENFYKGNSLNR